MTAACNFTPLVRLGAMLALVLVISGCTKAGQFDPTELLNSETFDSKKKLTGQREPLFPNGVPGTETGVPPDLVKGYQAPPEPPEADATAAPTPPPAEKPKPKPKPKLARAAAPASDPAFDKKAAPTRINIGAAPKPAAAAPQGGDQTVWPAPPTVPAQQTAGSQSVWPAPPPASPPPPAQSIWPNPPAPGTH